MCAELLAGSSPISAFLWLYLPDKVTQVEESEGKEEDQQAHSFGLYP